MNTLNHQPTGDSETYKHLLKLRATIQAKAADIKRDLDDCEAAIAALAPRQAAPAAPREELATCDRCGGGLHRIGSGPWVHDRDGQMACEPGHSGPVASPLAQTTAFQAVQPGDATQVIPAVEDGHFSVGPMTPEAQALWGEARLGSTVAVHWKHGGHITGVVRAKFDDRLIVHDGEAVYDLNPADIARIEPADLDTPTATPAQDGGQ